MCLWYLWTYIFVCRWAADATENTCRTEDYLRCFLFLAFCLILDRVSCLPLCMLLVWKFLWILLYLSPILLWEYWNKKYICCVQVYVYSGKLNSVPLAYVANALSTKPSPSLSTVLMMPCGKPKTSFGLKSITVWIIHCWYYWYSPDILLFMAL